MAGIKIIDRSGTKACDLIYMPRWCTRGRHKRTLTLMKRGLEQYEKATDVLNMIRLNHRLKILESQFFNKRQLLMTGMHKWRYLRPASSSSEQDLVRAPDSNSSFDEAE